jgi:hypothetical protein
MAENKTKANEASVDDFLAKTDEATRKDCYRLIDIMSGVTGKPAKMWGPAIIGFDQYHYKYESGREGDICKIGFSPRKANLTLYVLAASGEQQKLLDKLGNHKTGKGCLYIKKLDDVNEGVLKQLISSTIVYIDQKYA